MGEVVSTEVETVYIGLELDTTKFKTQFNDLIKDFDNKSRGVFDKLTGSVNDGIKEGWSNGFSSILQTSAAHVDVAFKFVGGLLQTAFGGLGDSLDLAQDFEQEVADINAALGGLEPEELENLSSKIRELAISPKFSVDVHEASTVIEKLAKTGVELADILGDDEGGVAEAVIILQNALGSNFEKTAETTAMSLSAFKIKSDEATEAVDGIVSAVNSSKLSIEDYRYAIANSGAIANEMGISFSTFNAVIAATGNAFSSGRTGGTAFKNFLIRLNPATEKGQELFKDLGLSINGVNQFFDNGSLKEMPEVIEILSDAFEGLSDEERMSRLKDMFGTDGQLQMALKFLDLGKEGLEGVIKAQEEFSAANSAEIAMNTLSGRTQIFWDIVNGLKTSIGFFGIALKTVFYEYGIKYIGAFHDKMAPILSRMAQDTDLAKQTISDLLLFLEKLATNPFDPSSIDLLTESIRTLHFYIIGDTLSIDEIESKYKTVIDFFEGFKIVAQAVGDVVRTFIDIIITNSNGLIGALVAIGIAMGAVTLANSALIVSLSVISSPLTALILLVGGLGFAFAENFFGIQDAMNKVLPSLLNFVNEIITVLRSLWTALTSPSDANTQTFQNSIDALGKAAKALLQNFVTQFSGVFTAFLNSSIAFIGSFANLITDALNKVGNFLVNFNYNYWWGKANQSLIDFINSIATWITTNQQKIIGFGTSIAKSIADGFVTIVVKISEAIGGLFNYLDNFFKGSGKTQSTEYGTTVSNSIVDGLKNIWEAVLPILTAFLSSALTWFGEQDWEGIGKGVGTAIAKGISTLWSFIVAILIPFEKSFVTWFVQQDWYGIGKGVVTAMEKAVSTLWSIIVAILNPFLTSFATWFVQQDWYAIGNGVVTAIAKGISTLWDLVLPNLAKFVTDITNWFLIKDKWENLGIIIIYAIVSIFEALWAGKSFISGAIVGVAGVLVEFLGSMTKWFVDHLESWKELGLNIVRGIIGPLLYLWESKENPGTDVLSAMVEFNKLIYDFFATTDWKRLGTALVDGIIAGIKSTSNSIWEAMKWLGGKFLEGWNKTNEINSPAKIYFNPGSYVVEGIIAGIQAMYPSAIDAIRKLADIMNKSFDFVSPLTNIPVNFDTPKNIPDSSFASNQFDTANRRGQLSNFQSNNPNLNTMIRNGNSQIKISNLTVNVEGSTLKTKSDFIDLIHRLV